MARCFVDSINGIFRVAYDLIMKATVLATPISAHDVTHSLSNGYVSLEFLTVMIVSPMISSFVCYYGELLIGQSERFRQAIYSCGWERSTDRRVRTSITLMLQRALRPAAILTMFSTICLDALCESERFRQAIYSCGWERSYDRRVRTSIILILQRALRPAAIQTVFGTICLVVLSESERFRQAIYSCGWERSSDRRVRKSIALILQRALRPAAIESVFSTVCLVALSEWFIAITKNPSQAIKSSNYRTAIYSCGWERIYDRRTRSSIVLIFERTTRPVAVYTMFRILCQRTLSNLCKH
ncbi:unnamed protein product [Chrysodeixis includens]|uniref:Uncharacterized protein n=1 Tax=Chrysodeixis includens TaxID=689277 RepID=A0A9N8Q0U4_CHRIL|nr:unnamed protein product [Chrysodeixis includens]